ncbi:eukaryotic translation initiation factor 3 subunit A-like [Condylostylus longicornis]|uniref:eukaryotic translation initiation factor 3 subunit A-like n=1 Tax=Condylostylus longicornis TaxID=2530218 RepID=UPI00244DC264|nr:eukaryotic translation initiation factor 3 subunit A-like [Condylostylus longicornis]
MARSTAIAALANRLEIEVETRQKLEKDRDALAVDCNSLKAKIEMLEISVEKYKHDNRRTLEDKNEELKKLKCRFVSLTSQEATLRNECRMRVEDLLGHMERLTKRNEDNLKKINEKSTTINNLNQLDALRRESSLRVLEIESKIRELEEKNGKLLAMNVRSRKDNEALKVQLTNLEQSLELRKKESIVSIGVMEKEIMDLKSKQAELEAVDSQRCKRLHYLDDRCLHLEKERELLIQRIKFQEFVVLKVEEAKQTQRDGVQPWRRSNELREEKEYEKEEENGKEREDGTNGTRVDKEDGTNGTTVDKEDGTNGTRVDKEDGTNGTCVDKEDGTNGTRVDKEDGTNGTCEDKDGTNGTQVDKEDGTNGTRVDKEDGTNGTCVDKDGTNGTQVDKEDGTTVDKEDGTNGTTVDKEDGTTVDKEDGTTVDKEDRKEKQNRIEREDRKEDGEEDGEEKEKEAGIEVEKEDGQEGVETNKNQVEIISEEKEIASSWESKNWFEETDILEMKESPRFGWKSNDLKETRSDWNLEQTSDTKEYESDFISSNMRDDTSTEGNMRDDASSNLEGVELLSISVQSAQRRSQLSKRKEKHELQKNQEGILREIDVTLALHHFSLIRYSTECHLAYIDVLIQTKKYRKLADEAKELELVDEKKKIDAIRFEALKIKLRDTRWLLEGSHKCRDESARKRFDLLLDIKKSQRQREEIIEWLKSGR